LAGLLGLALIASGALFGGAAQSALAATCPNEALRIQSNVNPTTQLPFSSGLADCRAYEMISPVDKQAHDAIQGYLLSRDGQSSAFNIFGQLLDGEGFNYLNGTGNNFLAGRTGAGWATRATTVPGALVKRTNGTPNLLDYSPDFSRAATCGADGSSSASSQSSVICALRRPDGTWVATPTYRSITGTASDGGGVNYFGGSADLSHVLFTTPSDQFRLLPSDTYACTSNCSSGNRSIYEIAGLGTDSPSLRLVNLDSNGSQIAAGTSLGIGFLQGSSGATYQAISDDGETIYFTATPIGGTVQTIFARRNGTTTTAISNPSPSECTTCSATPFEGIYQGASADGSKAFFLSKQQLVNADTDTTQDLYEYDFNNPAGHRIVQVSGGGSGDLTPGSGANVSGVARTSADGTRAYFVATGVLTSLPNGNGQAATAGAPNLYMFERDAAHPVGFTKFVATLLPADSGLWLVLDQFRQARTTPDGRFLLFGVTAALTPGDLDTARDAYLYDAISGKVTRISIGEPAFPASNNGNTAGIDVAIGHIEAKGTLGASADVNQAANPISDDGSDIIFSTTEQLQADDVNGVSDIYEWHEGTVSMVSDGQNSSGSTASLAAMSASGDDIVFSTRSRLTGLDADELLDIYDAKVEGGFPYVPPAPLCASVEACHGPAAAATTSASAASAAFSGTGNVVPPKQKPKKHKKKHHKKQHPKKHSTGKRR
jgi:hypothetical protein